MRGSFVFGLGHWNRFSSLDLTRQARIIFKTVDQDTLQFGPLQPDIMHFYLTILHIRFHWGRESENVVLPEMRIWAL